MPPTLSLPVPPLRAPCSNDYFTRLLEDKWVVKTTHTENGKTVPWKGPKQYVDAATGTLMMLPSDLALLEDAAFKAHVVAYAKDKEAFFKDFAASFGKLLELGVTFPAGSVPAKLK